MQEEIPPLKDPYQDPSISKAHRYLNYPTALAEAAVRKHAVVFHVGEIQSFTRLELPDIPGTFILAVIPVGE